MTVRFKFARIVVAAIVPLVACSLFGQVQQSSSGQGEIAHAATLPDAPAAAVQAAPPQNTQQTNAEEVQRQKAEEQIKEQEHQRTVGIIPAFNVTYHADAVSLSSAQKFRLQFRADTDPYVFGLAMFVAGIGEVKDSNRGFGWGPAGYAKRTAAAYGDNVIGHTFGNAILPSLLHQDPRYFRLGHGTIGRRILNPLEGAVVSRHDYTGKREPNYSNVLGNLIGGAISNLYYPAKNGNEAAHTFRIGLTVAIEGALGSELQEFWPDISRKFFHKDPTHGLDAQARAVDAGEKQKRQQESEENKQQ